MENQLQIYYNTKLEKHNIKNSYIYKDFPFDKIYETSKKEASRKKPIFFLHKYFARRTTCNFRLMLLSMLSNNDEDVWDKFYNQCRLSEKENITLLDPFMGGGTTIYEALRLNMSVIGNDLQPISKFVTLAEILPLDEKRLKEDFKELENKVGEKIKKYYKTQCPCCKESADVMYNFHSKIIKYKNNEISLFSSHIISKRGKDYTYVCPNCNEVVTTKCENDFLACPKCESIFNLKDDSNVKNGKIKVENEEISLLNLSRESGYPFESRIIAIEYYCPHCKNHGYKTPTKDDEMLYKKACEKFDSLTNKKIPNIKIPDGYNTRQILNHGYHNFSDLFNKRQLLCLSELLKGIEEIKDEQNKFWFLVTFSGILEMNNMFCRYQANAYKISNMFFNHAYVPICMPTENCVWGTTLGTGTFVKTINKILKGKEFSKNIYDIYADNKHSDKIYNGDRVLFNVANDYNELSKEKPLLTNMDSRNLEYINDKSVDIVLTDPPYSDNIMYSELLDFFHSWIYLSDYARNKLGFNTPLTPKSKEIVVNKAISKDYDNYSSGLESVFKECYRVLKNDGVMAFTYHDRKIDGWKSIYKALINSGFIITAAYPIHSESRTGAHTSSKESIVFDMFLVCNKKNEVCENFNEQNLINKIRNTFDKYIIKLNKINAELTNPDIDNIFISQLISKISCMNLNLEEADEVFERIYNRKDEILANTEINNLVGKRTGWWAESHKK